MNSQTLRKIFTFVALSASLGSIAAISEETQATTIQVSTPQLSEDEFQAQRQLMIKDTATKVEVLQTAHECAKASKTPADFAACNQQLREAILGKK